MIMRKPTVWRWSHTRHHTDTIIVGRDPEIAVLRPPDLVALAAQLLRPARARRTSVADVVRNACGRLSAEEETFIPEMERPKVYPRRAHLARDLCRDDRRSRWRLGRCLPLMLVGLPRVLRRLALPADRPAPAWRPRRQRPRPPAELAHRLHEPVCRFIYWNMNYHVEHHMFPMVPYHALPKLHEVIKHDLPAPISDRSWTAYREMIPAFLRQLRKEGLFPRARELPADRMALARGRQRSPIAESGLRRATQDQGKRRSTMATGSKPAPPTISTRKTSSASTTAAAPSRSIAPRTTLTSRPTASARTSRCISPTAW